MKPSPHSPRLTTTEALDLFLHADTAELMGRADEVRRRLHGQTTCFTHSLNLNPTNVCENRCELCAFWREPGAPDAYVLSLEQAREHLIAAKPLGLTDLHIVAGLHDDLSLEYYESLFKMAREILPPVLIQGLTAVEIHYMAGKARLTIRETLQRLLAAGLSAIPGGGAEIFGAETRGRICSRKISADDWLEVHAQAHQLGLCSNATLLFGHLETPEDIIGHLARLRDQQDKTGGFKAFIPLPFQPQGTKLAVDQGPSGYSIVRVVALARLFLDNIPHIRMLVNYVDRKLLQVLLQGGADDIGGTSLEERIARAAGAPQSQRFASIDEMKAFITDLGLRPSLVNSRYEVTGTGPLPLIESRATPSPLLTRALGKAGAGKRLTNEEAVVLHDEASLHQLGILANRRRLKQVPGKLGTFVIDRNISSTNICEAGCKFCAFHVAPGSGKGFSLTSDEILQQVIASVEQGATQVLIQGGLNPDIGLPFYEQLFRNIKKRVTVCLHCLSPAEITYMAKQSDLTIAETLHRLREAGMDSLPGGGAEILVDDWRQQVSPRKISAGDWFAVMETAQAMGMKTTATMVYGFGETSAQRVEHLMRIRDLQDRTGGFTAFIPWSFQPNRTQWQHPAASGPDYLRMVALARLVLDNVAHIQAGWVTEGPHLAQLAMVFGADDFGGVLMEEKVVKATGTAYAVTPKDVISLIAQTGLTPAQRDTQYQILKQG